MPDQNVARACLKTACSWISCDKNHLEFQFCEKVCLDNIHDAIYSSGHKGKQVKYQVTGIGQKK